MELSPRKRKSCPRLLILCVTHFYQNPVFWAEKVFFIPSLY